MKRVYFLFFLLFVSVKPLLAQSNNVILFTENGEKFQVVLNGVLQNTNPETNVKLTQLPAPNYKCRIIFADTKLGLLDFNLFFREIGEELTMTIKQNKNGEYVSRYVSSIPIATAPQSPSIQKVIIYSETPTVETVTTTVSQTTTTHSSGTNPSGENTDLRMEVKVNEDGNNVSITTDGMNIENNLVVSDISTTTTTITTTSTKGPTVITPSQTTDVNGYTGPIGCPVAIDLADFEVMKETISTKDFESTKLSIAKQAVQENCLLAGQVAEILSLFDFENTKLEFAKYAYAYTYDQGNYFKVNEAFEFESSVEDLNNFLNVKN